MTLWALQPRRQAMTLAVLVNSTGCTLTHPLLLSLVRHHMWAQAVNCMHISARPAYELLMSSWAQACYCMACCFFQLLQVCEQGRRTHVVACTNSLGTPLPAAAPHCIHESQGQQLCICQWPVRQTPSTALGQPAALAALPRSSLQRCSLLLSQQGCLAP